MRSTEIVQIIGVAFLLGLISRDVFAFDEEIANDYQLVVYLDGATDARFRAISQSNLRPVVQGYIDFRSEATGIYAGTYLPSLKNNRDVSGNDEFELDFYGGRRFQISSAFAIDFGSNVSYFKNYSDANTVEMFTQFSYASWRMKISDSISDFYGFSNSRGSTYIDVVKTIAEVNGFVFDVHLGRQNIKKNNEYSYFDASASVTREVGEFSLQFGLFGCNADKQLYKSMDGQYLGKTGISLVLTKKFRF